MKMSQGVANKIIWYGTKVKSNTRSLIEEDFVRLLDNIKKKRERAFR